MLSLLLDSLLAGFICSASIAIFTYVVASFNKDIIKVICANFFVILGILFNAEVIFRYVFDDHNMPNLYHAYDNFYFNQPLLNTHFADPEFNSVYLTNYQGFRVGNVLDQYKSVDSCDVLFVGDSFTQGAQVDYNQMFSSLYEEKVPEIKVVNAGISGANIIDEFHFICNIGMRLRPKKIIVQLCVNNDFFNIVEHQSGVKEWFKEKSALYRSASIIFPSSYKPKIRRCVDPFFEDEISNINYNIFYTKSSSIKTKDKETLIYAINRIKTIATQIGAKLTVLLIPTKEQITEDCLLEVVDAYQLDTNFIDINYPNAWLSSKMDSLQIDYDVNGLGSINGDPMTANNQNCSGCGCKQTDKVG